ncbi:agenet domain-containing family protein [Striga asiatica]|uniref:Agenet domain-containing family protein n=1 Tax=Striga asiatica TaxID=4170 RepID=A0A5A7PPP5_STRAF|nr:agenet domain-containing family protein [Striga asiatica]
MDYNDNDYEGHNLHLAGEENSKFSSVLRPFALPKFDFDDSLQGHLRFDSLVENEVFLGIPSQEDNHWIEDFSRGGSGIEFSSSATESCALPRHINVWSEATSSESVEMLLKAVGQEEMVPGENLMKESNPGNMLGSSTRQVENVGQDNTIDDVNDLKDSSISPAEVEGNISRSNQSDEIEGVQTEVSVHAGGTSASCYGVAGDGNKGFVFLTSETSEVHLKIACDNQEETCGLVNESVSTHVQQETVPVRQTDDKIESSPQNVAACAMEFVDQDNVSDVGVVSSSDVTHAISQEQEKGCNPNEGNLGAETEVTECHSSHEIPSPMESSRGEHLVQIGVANFSDVPTVTQDGESVSTKDRCNEVVFDAAGDSHCRTTVFAPSTEIKKSEGCSLFHESSISLQGEAVEHLEVLGSDAITSTVSGDTEPNQVPAIQPNDNPTLIGSEDIQPETHSYVETPHVTSEVICDSSDNVGESNHEDGQAYSVAGDSCGKKPVNDDMSGAGDTATTQENLEDWVNHAAPPLLAGSKKTGTEDTTPMQLDACEHDLDVPITETDIKKLAFDSGDVSGDGNENKVSTFSGEGIKVGTTTGLQLNNPAEACPASNTEAKDTKLTSSCGEGDELVDSDKHKPPSCDMTLRDQSKETQPIASVSMEPLELSELTHAFETEKGVLPDSETGEAQERGQSLLLVEPSGGAVPDEGHKESSEPTPVFETDKGSLVDIETREIVKRSDQSLPLVEPSNTISAGGPKEVPEKMDTSFSDLKVQNIGAVAAPTEMAMGEAGRNSGDYPSTISDIRHGRFRPSPDFTGLLNRNLGHAVASCSMEMDKPDPVAPTGVRCTGLSESMINNQTPLKRDVEDIGKIVTKAENSVVNVSTEEEGTFTFDVRPLGGHSTGGSGKGSQSFSKIQACKLSLTGGGSPSKSGSNLTDPVEAKEVSHVSSLTPPSKSVRGPSERKTRRASGKSGKASANKGNQVKEATPLGQLPEKWEKSSHFLSPLEASQLVNFESAYKARGPIPIPTSSLPDLNSSVASPAFFQQPFTDLQQVQLRAQIFVYGSLIQGTAPDEACMLLPISLLVLPYVNAPATAVKMNVTVTNDGLPLEDAGPKAQDQTNSQSFLQIEAFTPMSGQASTGQASKKPIPSPVVNQMLSLPSPLWNVSTASAEALPPGSTSRSAVIDYLTGTPFNPYQTPPVRNYVPHTTWSSQAPFPVPWLASSQTTPYDVSTTYPAFPGMKEPVKLAPNKESTPVVSASTSYASGIPTSHTIVSTNAEAPSVDLKMLKASSGQTVDTKTKKRKKSSSAEDAVRLSVTASLVHTASSPVVASQLSNKGPAVEAPSQFPFTARYQGDQMHTPVISSHYSTSVAVATPSSFVQKGSSYHFFPVVSPSIANYQPKGGDLSVDKRAQKIEDCSKVEEAKLQAQEAATQAAAAISQCEGVWNQLGEQKQAGLKSDAQCKLASAAAAIAAAASVAKAAAAAAKIASAAALQAKQMADEAVTTSGAVDSSGHDVNLVNASPNSILRGGDSNNAPGLAISAAREAAKKRIEAASAATRYAENLDAIVKAAELAAEAVSHAGKIVSLGEPFSLSGLAEAGPNNYWKVPQVGVGPGLKSNDKKNKSSSSKAGEVPEDYMNRHEEPDKDMYIASDVEQAVQELSGNVVDDHVNVEENIIASGKHRENFKPQKDEKVSNSVNTPGISHPDIESRSTSHVLSSIKEGSYVEVLKDCGDSKKAWFSASVLSLKDSEALVLYTGLQSAEGSAQLQEWVSVEAKDGQAPKVRVPHDMTTLQFEATRKRRRAAAKDYNWSVGDKVDAWVQNCWREGVIAEKSKKDATGLTVHFPEQGESLTVKVWNLRPTLIWSDGQWTEWHRAGPGPASQGDSPAEKRPKLGGSSIEAKGKTKVAESTDFAVTQRNEVSRLPLSANEKLFNIGSTKSEKNKPNMVETKRPGVEKQPGSRVVFGVPKPGKKRKFMEVSKHYTSDRVAKTNVSDDSMKLSQLLPPLGSGPRSFKHNSKPDSKDKQAPESRPRSIKSGRPPSVPSRTSVRKDDSTSLQPNARSTGGLGTGKGSASSNDSELGERNTGELNSSSKVGGTSAGSIVFSSQARTKDSRKKTARRDSRFDRLHRGRPALASERSADNESNANSVPEVSEPRRSIRRIQPTSRVY